MSLSDYTPPAQLARIEKSRDALASRACDLAIVRAAKMLRALETAHPGHRFEVYDGNGSQSIEITPPLRDSDGRMIATVLGFDWEEEMARAETAKLKRALAACGAIFDLADYLEDSFRYVLGHVTAQDAGNSPSLRSHVARSAKAARLIRSTTEQVSMAQRVKAQEIVLFATNTGELYQTHKTLARIGVTYDAWVSHIEAHVLPRYRRECHLPGASMSPEELEKAARDLLDYYAAHIAEGA